MSGLIAGLQGGTSGNPTQVTALQRLLSGFQDKSNLYSPGPMNPYSNIPVASGGGTTATNNPYGTSQ
jgi:hypothetical protein